MSIMRSENKTVLIVTSHFPPNIGGVESHLHALVTELIKHSWKAIISTYQPLASKRNAEIVERQSKLIIYRMPWLGFNIVHKLTPYPALEFLYLFPGLLIVTLLALLKHNKEIKVIHCQGLVPTTVGIVVRFFFPKRLIASIHNLYFFPQKGLYRIFARLIFSAADLTLVPTEFSGQELKSIGVPREKIGRFRYWIDLKYFSPVNKNKAKRKLGWKKFTVFFVGRLIETKGVGSILKVIKNLNSQIQVVIAGDGPMRSEVQKATEIYSNLFYLGRVEDKLLHTCYSSADLVLMPSLVDEGFGFVVMEAVSCGTPVLASNKGGLSEAVSAITGVLIRPDSRVVKESIEYLFNNKKELAKLTRNTRRYALANFSNSNIEDIIRAYEG